MLACSDRVELARAGGCWAPLREASYVPRVNLRDRDRAAKKAIAPTVTKKAAIGAMGVGLVKRYAS